MHDEHPIFLQPHMSGGRFEAGGVPTEVLKEFHVYRELVLSVARALFFRDHPTRQRVPRGFSERFELLLTGVDSGSAVPSLRRPIALAAQLPLATPSSANPPPPDEFERARDLINELIEATRQGEGLPEDFPREALPYFRRFGRSLREEERMELRPSKSEPGAILDRSTRREILSRSGESYEEELSLMGPLKSADVRGGQFTLLSAAYGEVICKIEPSFEQDLLSALRAYRAIGVRLTGVGQFKPNGELTRLDPIEQFELEELGPDLEARLEALEGIEPGWLGEGSLAPSAELCRDVSNVLHAAVYEHNTYAPLLFPTPEGGIQAEWRLEGVDIEAEFLPSGELEVCAHQEEGEPVQVWRIDEAGVAARLAQFINDQESS